MEFVRKERRARHWLLAELCLLAVPGMQRETNRRYHSFVMVVSFCGGRRCRMMFNLRRQDGCQRRQNTRQTSDEQADQNQSGKHDANARDRNPQAIAVDNIFNSVLLGEDHVNR